MLLDDAQPSTLFQDELARVRRKFVDKVSKVLIKQLLDDLLDDGVLNDGQKDSIVEEYSATADKARVLIDTVKKKGDEASRKLIAHIHSRDSALYSELGLSCVQPAQPAAVRLSEQEWSITLNRATESFWMDKVKDNNVYPVDKKSIKNRVALLITNIKFTDEKMNRNGADKDEENMEKLLTTLKYEVVKYTNLTGKAIDDAILKFSKHPKLKETDSVIVVIMSHGKLGKVLGVDWKKGDEKPDEFLIDNIYKHLGSEKCPALLDKPKIIIIQACRGEEEGSAFVRDVVSDDASQSNLPPPADEDNLEADALKCVHKEKDFTALLSCTPDTVSYRQRDLGSFLIQYIVEVFNTFAHQDDIAKLFIRVMQRFVKFSPRTKRQMPTKVRCTLIKLFYFFPLDNKMTSHNDPPLSMGTTGSDLFPEHDWIKLEPEVNCGDADDVPTYSLQSEAGAFECSVSGLRWVCKEKVSFKYQFGSWEGHLDRLETMQYIPGGPLLDITVIAGKLDEAHLPHWICTEDNPTVLDKFAVLHIDTCGDIVEQVSEVTSSHVKLYQPAFSLRGVLMRAGFSVRIHCKVLIFKTIRTSLTLHVYMIPCDPALEEKIQNKESSSGYEMIQKPYPAKSLKMRDCFTLTADKDTAEIYPEKLKLIYEWCGPNFFEVFIDEPDSNFQLGLTHQTSGQVWTCAIRKDDYQNTGDVPVMSEFARLRRKLVGRVSGELINQLLDGLLEDGVLNDGEKDSILQENSNDADRARRLIDMIRKKGREASRKLLTHLQNRDPMLCAELGLPSGPPV
ncbi:uncharacterized protein LOC125888799 isoform X2 [Epinephelus fuscoguttatus]|uniref:uncharacterized protein LOC125888799 isoform X2 n=1 Tax=Epinephelus fuscoguttatus TaxID=293821 RepID=UPI0020D14C26|nr:uncharacterized protein LOC125888799 isoform X2 [Epinephelus fuscoguttatus]